MIQQFVSSTIDNYLNMIIMFILIIFVTVNAKDMAHNLIIGIFIKVFKSYQQRDILKIDGKEWFVDHLNSYRIKFLEVIEIDQDTIILSKVEMSIAYTIFLKSKIIRCGSFR